MQSGIYPRIYCPSCGRNVAVQPQTKKVGRHNAGPNLLCERSGTSVMELEPAVRQDSYRATIVHAMDNRIPTPRWAVDQWMGLNDMKVVSK